MGPRRRRRRAAVDEIRDRAPGRLVVEAFGRDLDMVVEQRQMLSHQRVRLVVIPGELFADGKRSHSSRDMSPKWNAAMRLTSASGLDE